MTPSLTTGRQRLDLIRKRTHDAREERAKARQLLDAAREEHDQDAEAVAMIAFDRADESLQVAERLESQLLGQIAGVDGGFITRSPRTTRWTAAGSARSPTRSMPVSRRRWPAGPSTSG